MTPGRLVNQASYKSVGDQLGYLGDLGQLAAEPILTVLVSRTTFPHRSHLFRQLEVTVIGSFLRSSPERFVVV